MDNDNIMNLPNPPSSPRIKHKRKKRKENENPFKDNEKSTKKKKKSPQQRTKKKNRKNQSDSQNTPNNRKSNYHKKKKKKNKGQNGHKKRKHKYRKKYKRNQYRLGVVVILPQSKNSWGWVHCKHDNMMYRLSFSQKTMSLQLHQKLLFIARQRKNGLSSIQNIANVHTLSLHAIHSEYLNHKNESIASNDTYVLNTPLNRSETNDTEFKSFLRVHYNKKFKENMIKMIEKYLNGFINMNGGTIYIGINDAAIVKGIDFIDRKEFDIMQQLLPQKLNQWEPQIHTRAIIQSLKFEMKDVVNIENKEHCGYILPKYKVIEASISPIYDDATKQQVICQASDGFVYCREGTSLTVYDDVSMTADHKCSKKRLRINGYNYGFWEPVSKHSNALDLMLFDEGDDVVTADDSKIQSASASSQQSSTEDDDAEDTESDSLLYLDSEEQDEEVEDEDVDSDSADIDSDEDREDSDHQKNMKYVRRPSEEMNDNEIRDMLAMEDENMKRYNALFDYNGGTMANELLFKRDDKIIVDDSKNNGIYLYGYKQRAPNDKGWFPHSYVKETN